jgi:hypothetical protein
MSNLDRDNSHSISRQHVSISLSSHPPYHVQVFRCFLCFSYWFVISRGTPDICALSNCSESNRLNARGEPHHRSKARHGGE